MQSKELIRMTIEHSYETSKDYNALFELIQKCSVICIVHDDSMYGKTAKKASRAACASIYNNVKKTVQISSKGRAYIHAYDKKDFIKQCKNVDLEYILPTKGIK